MLQTSLSNTNSWSLLKLMSIESVMPTNHLILCRLLLLLPSIFPSIRVFLNESVLHTRWPKYWSFSFSIGPSNEYSGLISFRMTGWISWLFIYKITCNIQLYICIYMCVPSPSVMFICLQTPWAVAHQAPLSMGFSRQVRCHSLLQGTFMAQGSNLHFLHLLHWWAGSLSLVPPRKPYVFILYTFI